MKKAQIMGQPIIFIFIAIVAILTLTLGIKYVYKLKVLGEETQVVRELKEIESDLQRVYQLSYQSSEKFAYSFPSSVNKICFLETPTDLGPINNIDSNQKNYIKLSTGKNLFIFSDAKLKERSSFSELIGTTQCFDIENKISLILTNQGKKVIISI